MNENRKKIIIVDDEINLLMTLQFIFEDAGFDVTMVPGGVEAVEKMNSNSYDVALLDINMPVMDGLQTLREIKKLSPATSVFMMTGNRENVHIKKCLEEGAVTVFYKPFSVNELLQVMEKETGKTDIEGIQ